MQIPAALAAGGLNEKRVQARLAEPDPSVAPVLVVTVAGRLTPQQRAAVMKSVKACFAEAEVTSPPIMVVDDLIRVEYLKRKGFES